jgi:hypothetical protein
MHFRLFPDCLALTLIFLGAFCNLIFQPHLPHFLMRRMSRRMQYLLLKERENGGWRSQKKQGNSKRKNMYTMTIWEQHFKWKKNMLFSSLQTKTNGDKKDTRKQQIIFTFHVLGLYACIIHLSVAIRVNRYWIRCCHPFVTLMPGHSQLSVPQALQAVSLPMNNLRSGCRIPSMNGVKMYDPGAMELLLAAKTMPSSVTFTV